MSQSTQHKALSPSTHHIHPHPHSSGKKLRTCDVIVERLALSQHYNSLHIEQDVVYCYHRYPCFQGEICRICSSRLVNSRKGYGDDAPSLAPILYQVEESLLSAQ